MSKTASKLLATFESLPPEEQHELLTVMIRRSGELPDTIVSDEALVGLADSLFQVLDAEESAFPGSQASAWEPTTQAASAAERGRVT